MTERFCEISSSNYRFDHGRLVLCDGCRAYQTNGLPYSVRPWPAEHGKMNICEGCFQGLSQWKDLLNYHQEHANNFNEQGYREKDGFCECNSKLRRLGGYLDMNGECYAFSKNGIAYGVKERQLAANDKIQICKGCWDQLDHWKAELNGTAM